MIEALGLLRKVEVHAQQVPHGATARACRLEPFLTEQWYVNVKPLAETAMAWVREGKTARSFRPIARRISPAGWRISNHGASPAQLWWGHQIPAWYGPDGDYARRRQ